MTVLFESLMKLLRQMENLISRKLAAYMFTGLLLLVLVKLHADTLVLSPLSQALMIALPILIGGQAYVDSKKTSRETKDEVVEPEKESEGK